MNFARTRIAVALFGICLPLMASTGARAHSDAPAANATASPTHDHAAHMAAMQAAQAGQPHDHAAHMAAMRAEQEAKAAEIDRNDSPWGKDYFPNIPLVDQDGNTVHFFDDLIKDKVVAVNFIFTSCTDSCPLETARLREVKRILGDRVGRDVFFYSISIDPKNDTPEVLKAYTEKYDTGPGWTFLTGNEDDIILLRRRLGLYLEDIQKESTDHNLNLVIGNQKTGRWQKSSPFENPYVLATQLGSWLHNWKLADGKDKKKQGYAAAPKLRKIGRGEQLFRTRCSACHAIGAEKDSIAAMRRIAPDLLGVTKRRERDWLERWLRSPEKMIAEKDPIATAMLAEYKNLVMPDLRLTQVEIDALLDYFDGENERLMKQASN